MPVPMDCSPLLLVLLCCFSSALLCGRATSTSVQGVAIKRRQLDTEVTELDTGTLIAREVRFSRKFHGFEQQAGSP